MFMYANDKITKTKWVIFREFAFILYLYGYILQVIIKKN